MTFEIFLGLGIQSIFCNFHRIHEVTISGKAYTVNHCSKIPK